MGAYCIGLTVFAAPHKEGDALSAYAEDMHGKWERSSGMSVQAINEVRRREEEAALRLLRLTPEWLDFPDAPYRSAAGSHFYVSDTHLFGTVARLERRDLVPLIARQIREVTERAEQRLGVRGRVRVYAPLGVGHHVDHQLVFWATRRLGPRFGVLYYEDYPYAAQPDALVSRLHEIGLPVRPRVTPVSDLIGVKVAAISRYKSQLEVLFGGADKVAAAVRSYMEEVAIQASLPRGEYAERVWQFPPVYSLGRSQEA